MEMKAAVFRKPHEPLTIESVEIDKPSGREVSRWTSRSSWVTRALASWKRWAPR